MLRIINFKMNKDHLKIFLISLAEKQNYNIVICLLRKLKLYKNKASTSHRSMIKRDINKKGMSQ